MFKTLAAAAVASLAIAFAPVSASAATTAPHGPAVHHYHHHTYHHYHHHYRHHHHTMHHSMHHNTHHSMHHGM